MFNTDLLFVFGLLISFTLARPNESLSVPTDDIPAVDTQNETVPIPTKGIVYGMIINFTSPDNIQRIESVPIENTTPEQDPSTSSGEKLVRKKRFLFGVIGAALESFRSDNWRECGRTPWGTTIYTNGIATACFGACPENVYCGYGYGYGGYGYGGSQINTVYIG